ncbi:hypothetical protein B0H17DRAFT_948902 [Mycena rosella]|uniref:Integrase core domain-containing protein n=1 Tax=Mycena rosella TaxID=1033263 RepID=A0AAD7G9J8_MYCRO|nr:hypothetical protein B0H17DRAFT_948902 [Mycena rosella]
MEGEAVLSRTALLNAFRSHYTGFQTSVAAIVQTPTDSVVIARLGDNLDEYVQLVQQHSTIFDAAELETIQTSLVAMQNDVRLEHRDAIDTSHNGRPIVVQRVQTGVVGQPRIHIDPDFLRWAYSQRSTASIHQFLGVSQGTICSALLANGILPADIEDLAAGEPPIVSYTGPLSQISEEELDTLILRLRSHFHRLIRWGIVLHGFVDGYARFITGLRASNNNTARTVLDVFLSLLASEEIMEQRIYMLQCGWRHIVAFAEDLTFGEGTSKKKVFPTTS